MNILKRLFQLKGTDKRPTKEEIETAFLNAVKILDEFKRKAYFPVTEHVESSFNDKSKFGGYPYLRNLDDWPVCPNCKRNMQLFIQLNLNEIPEQNEDKLLQLFYCTSSKPHCESDQEAFFPFSKSVVARKIRTIGESAAITPNMSESFDEKQIISWTAKDDYPHIEEYEDLGICFELEDKVLDLLDERQVCITLEKDKLFGWPCWIQGPEYPSDRKTGEKMELLFQIDSDDNLPYMFGDTGVGHLTQSMDNKDELAFGWACY